MLGTVDNFTPDTAPDASAYEICTRLVDWLFRQIRANRYKANRLAPLCSIRFQRTNKMPRITSKPEPIDLRDPPPLATVAEVCATLRISRATAGRYVESGRLVAVRFGRTVRIRTESVLALAS